MGNFFTDEEGIVRPLSGGGGIRSTQMKYPRILVRMPKPSRFVKRDIPKMIHGEPFAGYYLIEDSDGNKRKRAFTLNVELKTEEGETREGENGALYENPVILSISGAIWDRALNDCFSAGQNYDTLEKALKEGNIEMKNGLTNSDLKKLIDIWRVWHLNDTNGGTRKQEEIINKYYKENPNESHSYEKAVELLKKHDLLVDNGYQYGSKWLYEPLPQDVIDFVEEFQRKLNS